MTVPQRVAALDIGSDTVHVLIARASLGPDGATVAALEQHGALLELGRRVATKGRVGRRTAAELEAVVARFARMARRQHAELLIGATEAIRQASDGMAVVQRLETQLGQPVHVLSGAREAALGLAGVRDRLDPTGPQLVVDSGGASTELTMVEGRLPVASASLPVGAAALRASLREDPPGALQWALGAVQVGRALALAPDGSPRRAWATGGSAHNLAGLERTRGREGPQRLTTVDLSTLAADLLAHASRRIARRSGEDPARVRLLPPGLLIIAAVLAHYRLAEITVVPEGLRQGMVAAFLEQGDNWWRDGPAVP
jgi:exopolyphosphatase/guanosine-5'-triphosphate,3'-diphosphate pyrophosphatase